MPSPVEWLRTSLRKYESNLAGALLNMRQLCSNTRRNSFAALPGGLLVSRQATNSRGKPYIPSFAGFHPNRCDMTNLANA
jgi:hypothetical protein